MGFIKQGDQQPIIETHNGDPSLTDEETKKILEATKQAVKNIDKDSNNIELNKKSSE